MHRMFCVLSFVSFVSFVVAAQQTPNTPPAQGAPTFRTTTRLIVQTVSVTDRDGKPVEGLTAKDFVVTEDGEPQEISFVEFQRIESTAEGVRPEQPAVSQPTPAAAQPASAAATVQPTVPSQISTSQPGDIRYRNRRLVVLYFDLSAMPPPDLIRAYSSALRYIDTQMQPQDLLAIMTFQGGAVRVKQDFTDNRAALREVITTLIYGNDLDGDGIPDRPEDAASAFGQDDAEFNIFNTDRQLSALQTTVAMLRPLPEQKSLVYFASGLRLNGVDNQAQLRATTNAAIRANVSLYPIDARGLVAQAPLGDATRPSPGGLGMFTGQLAQGIVTNFQRSQDTLYALAKDTGGKALLDFNDLSRGIVDAANAQTSYYILGYYSNHVAADGKFRRVRVSLAGGLSAGLSYRQGYFGDKEFAKFTAADKERQLEEALMLENPVTDITIAMEVNYFQLNRAEYFVPVAIKIPGSELALARRGGASRTLIDFIGEVKDDFGNTIQNLRDKLDIKLSDETASQLAKRPIEYETGFTLLPGKYVVKYLIRDAETGRMGTYQTSFTVPNLMREEKRVPISSVVLSSQRVPLGDAIYSVQQKVAAEAANPLVYEGQKLVPSVTRVFSKSRELYVFLQAYERGATTTQPLVAFVSFYRGGVKAFETPPLAVTEGLDARSKAVPLRFSVPLDRLAPGQYECQVTVLDPTGQKAAFWQAPIVLIP
ncbi:MAG: VWA domain-containing protein [Acidobacteria bacterium RIFCSPLOWO2_12_FULL_65_11]|nr:MAG: VWA domain-containing protein [Acidobacteria bacterium RIFCSPLOWO2_02_FULL_64_15]OFW32480.1 MAG: VWA domain-containing protein [Acidobacteria bacterium RIFCSPLOWO2_12_FULL_65_11]